MLHEGLPICHVLYDTLVQLLSAAPLITDEDGYFILLDSSVQQVSPPYNIFQKNYQKVLTDQPRSDIVIGARQGFQHMAA